MSDKPSQKPLIWAFLISLFAGAIVVFLAVSGRTNERIKEEKEKNAHAPGEASQETPAPAGESAAPTTQNADGQATPSAPGTTEAADATKAKVDAAPSAAAGTAQPATGTSPQTPPSGED
jgi:hypothetical protein